MENIKNTDLDIAFLDLEDRIRVAPPVLVNAGAEGTFFPEEIIRNIEAARILVEKSGKLIDMRELDIPEELKEEVFELFNRIVAQNERS